MQSILPLILSVAMLFTGCGNTGGDGAADIGKGDVVENEITDDGAAIEKKSPEPDAAEDGAAIEKKSPEPDAAEDKGDAATMKKRIAEAGITANVSDIATIEMEGGGSIIVGLMSEKAPETVANFKKLANAGFYDGLIFHRIISGFMIQGGDPEGTGMGGSDKNIKGEFSQNGFSQNDLSHERGVISMARSGDPNSASSQFFIVHEASPHLDGAYAAFGKVIDGLSVVDELAAVPVTGARNETPVTPPVIKSIKVSSYK